MTEIKAYCDHCGKELNAMNDYIGTEIYALDCYDVDLCSNCINELQEIINSFTKRVVEQNDRA